MTYGGEWRFSERKWEKTTERNHEPDKHGYRYGNRKWKKRQLSNPPPVIGTSLWVHAVCSFAVYSDNHIFSQANNSANILHASKKALFSLMTFWWAYVPMHVAIGAFQLWQWASYMPLKPIAVIACYRLCANCVAIYVYRSLCLIKDPNKLHKILHQIFNYWIIKVKKKHIKFYHFENQELMLDVRVKHILKEKINKYFYLLSAFYQCQWQIVHS